MASSTKNLIAIVSGSNTGIGFEIVKKLADFSKDLTVYLTSRDIEKGEQALKSLGRDNVKMHQLDICNQDSVDKFSKFLKENHSQIDILVHNAGMAYKGNAFSEEVARNTINTNYVGTRRFHEAVADQLASDARVVFVSSRIGTLKKLGDNIKNRFLADDLSLSDLDQLAKEYIEAVKNDDWKEKGFCGSTYGTSKQLLTAYMKILAREETRASGSNRLINACCPGWCSTNMSSHSGPNTAEQGADTPFFLATLPKDQKDAHGYFWGERKKISWENASL